MSDTTTDDTTDEQATEYMRNEPASTFEAHLFGREAVENAGGDYNESTDRPATSLCERATSYGPFHVVDDVTALTSASETADGGTCAVCLNHVSREQGDAESEVSDA